MMEIVWVAIYLATPLSFIGIVSPNGGEESVSLRLVIIASKRLLYGA